MSLFVVSCSFFDDGIIVLDYKTGKYNEEKIKDYKFQLQIYAEIAEKSFKKPIMSKFVYFIDEQKLIEI